MTVRKKHTKSNRNCIYMFPIIYYSDSVFISDFLKDQSEKNAAVKEDDKSCDEMKRAHQTIIPDLRRT